MARRRRAGTLGPALGWFAVLALLLLELLSLVAILLLLIAVLLLSLVLPQLVLALLPLLPPLGLLIGGVDFADWEIMLRRETVDAAGETVPAVTIGIGIFLNTMVQFVIVAFAIFLLVKAINRLKRKQAEAPKRPSAPDDDPEFLRRINPRDDQPRN